MQMCFFGWPFWGLSNLPCNDKSQIFRGEANLKGVSGEN
jgi:hypothetical protein